MTHSIVLIKYQIVMHSIMMHAVWTLHVDQKLLFDLISDVLSVANVYSIRETNYFSFKKPGTPSEDLVGILF